MKFVINMYICKSNIVGKLKEGRLSLNILLLYVNYFLIFFNFLQIMVVYFLILFCYDLNSVFSLLLFFFIFIIYVNCVLNVFWCCISLRVEL